PRTELLLVCHQNAAAGVVFLLDLDDGDDDAVLSSLGLFGNGIGDALHHLAFLLDGAALQECDLHVRHYFSSPQPAKKKLSSNRAVFSASEPCTALCSMLEAHFLRMVPVSALAGLVAPISLRQDAMASFSFSSAMTMIGPLDMNVVRESKNGLPACTA